MLSSVKKYALEAVGTFLFVLLITGTLVMAERHEASPTSALMALLYGGVLAGLILGLAKSTGAHLNPAVTLAYAVEGRFAWKDTAPYLVSQCIGAFIASALLKYLFSFSSTLGAILPVQDDVPAFVQEFSSTLILLIAILSFPRDTLRHRLLSVLVTGGIAVLLVYKAGPLSGTGMNPARALAPALLSGQTEGLWIYLTAPFCAALSASALHSIYEAVLERKR